MKITAEEWLLKMMDECACKLSDPSHFKTDKLQTNALRAESMRDTSPRCGLLANSESLQRAVDKTGFGRWLFSGGCASAFKHCIYSECPRRHEFLATAPWKHIRDQAFKTSTP